MKIYLQILFFIFLIKFSIAENTNGLKDEFNKFKKKSCNDVNELKDSTAFSYENYVKNLDKKFSKSLKKNWNSFDLIIGKQYDKTINLIKQPKYNSKNQIKEYNIPISKIQNSKNNQYSKIPFIPLEEKKNINIQTAAFNFYGAEINVKYDAALTQININSISNETIADTWDKLCSTDYSLLLKKLLNKGTELKLNDWAYFMLVEQTTKQIFRDKKRQDILTWFLMVKSRYLIKIAYADNKTYLLIPSLDTIYNYSYFTQANLNYYLLSREKVTNIQTYNDKYPNSERLMNMSLTEPISLPLKIKEKNIVFKYDEKTYNIPIMYNQNLIDFYKDYPQCELSVYFSSAVSSCTKNSLIEGLAGIIKGKSKKESVEIVLNFVQNAFQYKTDIEQFGYKKFDFPEEMICYPFSDCEDRAIFFSYIIKEMLKLDVIGLTYPDYVCTAVNLPEGPDGNYLMVDDQTYTICDPTFIDAPIGEVLPQFKDKIPRIVIYQSKVTASYAEHSIWELINKGGGFEGDNGRTIITDKNGYVYVTGYFKDTLKIGDKVLISSFGSRDVFYAKFSKQMKLIWIKKLNGDGNDFPYSIMIDNKGCGYISGTFDKNLKSGNDSVSTIDPDIFVLKYNSQGEVIWLKKAELHNNEIIKHKNYFVVIIDSTASITGKMLLEDIDLSNNYEIAIDDNDDCIIAGAISPLLNLKPDKTLAGIFPVEFKGADRGGDRGVNVFYNISKALIDENNTLVKSNCNIAIAGLFAIINLANSSGSYIHGVAAQKALDKANPTFKMKYPKIYQNIGMIEIMKNENGIITIHLKNNNAVVFSNCEVSNGAKIKITTFTNGAARIDVLSGIKLGKAAWWYNLNFIKLSKVNDQLIFDYDDDHSQIIISVIPILLD